MFIYLSVDNYPSKIGLRASTPPVKPLRTKRGALGVGSQVPLSIAWQEVRV